MAGVDLKQTLKHLYRSSAANIAEVEVPAFRFLMIDGTGDPNTSEHYARAVEALFSVSYTAKFAMKKRTQVTDYVVMPLEGLWWADNMSVFEANDRSGWKWTMMILQPDFVPDDVVHGAMADVRKRKALTTVDQLRLETFTEGRCAQLLHIGPFSEEGPTIKRIHDYIARRASLTGKHHEIYLSDIRRAAPGKWKTIIRQPMKSSD